MFLCLSEGQCMSARARLCVSQRVQSRYALLGSLGSPRSSVLLPVCHLCFLSSVAFYGTGTWRYVTFTLSIFRWMSVTGRTLGVFLFLGCPGAFIIWSWLLTFLLRDLFCWFVSMPEANYLLSVSWGYIKVRSDACFQRIFKRLKTVSVKQGFSGVTVCHA